MIIMTFLAYQKHCFCSCPGHHGPSWSSRLTSRIHALKNKSIVLLVILMRMHASWAGIDLEIAGQTGPLRDMHTRIILIINLCNACKLLRSIDVPSG